MERCSGCSRRLNATTTEVRANAILRHFGSLNEALLCIDSWDVVKGIGPKTMDLARKTLTRKIA